MQADAVAAALAQAHRSEWAFVLSATVRVALWEGVRRVWAQVFRWTPPTLVDSTKLVPLTFEVVIPLIAMGGVRILADIFNPVSLL